MDQGVRDSYPQPPAHYKLFAEQQLEPPPIPPPEADLYVYGRSLYESPEKYFSERTKAVRDNLLMDPDNFSYKEELKKLNLSLMFNYYDLIDVLIENPDKWVDVQTQIAKVYTSIHYILNGMRPHQAREMLITSMEKQIDRRKEFLVELTEEIDKARAQLEKAKAGVMSVNTDPPELSVTL